MEHLRFKKKYFLFFNFFFFPPKKKKKINNKDKMKRNFSLSNIFKISPKSKNAPLNMKDVKLYSQTKQSEGKTLSQSIDLAEIKKKTVIKTIPTPMDLQKKSNTFLKKKIYVGKKLIECNKKINSLLSYFLTQFFFIWAD